MKRIDKYLGIIVILVLITGGPTIASPNYGYVFQESDTIPEIEKIEEEELEDPAESEYDEEDEDDNDNKKHRNRTRNYLNFDFGFNNYLEGNKFPDANDRQYTIKPFGSWYVGVSSVNKSKLFGPVYLEWGGGISWYNFKFQDPLTRIVKSDTEIQFVQDQNAFNSYKKSKLTVSYINVFLIPMIHTDSKSTKGWFWESDGKQGLRFGGGPYVGYRVGSKMKVVFNNGAKQKDKIRDNYFLSNLRYGWRTQLGWKGTDVFFSYDMNTLFEEDRGPELNPFSFGIIF